jgi:5-methylthioadenosine/S-adenosylhomocysteine deaminase
MLRAAFVAPMDSPVIRDGAVVYVAGKIAHIGSSQDARAAYPDAEPLDLGNAILLPGLVNAHTHLELSACSCGPSPGGTFTQWLLSVRQRSRIDPATRERDVTSAVKIGIEQSVRFGVTCVGDISSHCDVTRKVIRESPLRAVSYGEVLGLAKLRWRFDELMQQALRASGSHRMHRTPSIGRGSGSA